MPIKILDIGQCGFDGPRMAARWKSAGASVDCAANASDAVGLLAQESFDIVLVNRILAADRGSGLEVIRSLLAAGLKAPIMLVSDLSEAQDQAVALGAVRGFGKAALHEQSTLDLVFQTAGAKPRP